MKILNHLLWSYGRILDNRRECNGVYKRHGDFQQHGLCHGTFFSRGQLCLLTLLRDKFNQKAHFFIRLFACSRVSNMRQLYAS